MKNNNLFDNLINKVNNIISIESATDSNVGLLHGQMGVAIYLYTYARFRKDAKYEDVAGDIVDKIFDKFHKNLPIDFINGMAGIGYGLNYLINNKYIEGDIEEILKELDDKIFQELSFNTTIKDLSKPIIIIGIAFYLTSRMKICKKGSESYDLFAELIIQCINDIHTFFFKEEIKFYDLGRFDLAWELPNLLILLGEVHKLDIYTYKIEKFIDELAPLITSYLPALGANKFHLLYGIFHITIQYKKKSLIEHSLLLKQCINVAHIIKEEFKSKAINFRNGITGFYFITDHYCKMTKDENDNFSILIFEKILNSSFWEILDEPNQNFNCGMFEGLSGIGFGLVKLINNKKIEID